MKQFQFLLLDAGPIIKLFELGLWDNFIKKCDVAICRTVAEEAKYASQEFQDIRIDLIPYEEKGLIRIVDVEFSAIKTFLDKLPPSYIIHDGEKETLAFMFNSPEGWKVCAADKAVFSVLGTLGKSEQGISLEEILVKIGLSQNLGGRQYTKKFREKYTGLGQIESIQGNSF